MIAFSFANIHVISHDCHKLYIVHKHNGLWMDIFQPIQLFVQNLYFYIFFVELKIKIV